MLQAAGSHSCPEAERMPRPPRGAALPPQRKLASEGTAGSQAAPPRAGAQKADRLAGVSTNRQPTDRHSQGLCSEGSCSGDPAPKAPGGHTGQGKGAGRRSSDAGAQEPGNFLTQCPAPGLLVQQPWEGLGLCIPNTLSRSSQVVGRAEN